MYVVVRDHIYEFLFNSTCTNDVSPPTFKCYLSFHVRFFILKMQHSDKYGY